MLTFTTREIEEIWIALIDKCERVLKQAAELESIAERLESGETDPSLDPGNIGPEAMRQTARDFRAWESSIGQLSSRVRAEIRKRETRNEGGNMNDFKLRDIVTVDGYRGEWEVTHVTTHGHGPNTYELKHTETGHVLSANRRMALVTR